MYNTSGKGLVLNPFLFPAFKIISFWSLDRGWRKKVYYESIALSLSPEQISTVPIPCYRHLHITNGVGDPLSLRLLGSIKCQWINWCSPDETNKLLNRDLKLASTWTIWPTSSTLHLSSSVPFAEPHPPSRTYVVVYLFSADTQGCWSNLVNCDAGCNK